MKSQRNKKTDSLTHRDLDKIADLLDSRLAPLATKEYVHETVTASETRIKDELKSYIDEGVATVMDDIDNVAKLLTEKERVDKLEKWAKEVSRKVGIKLEI